MDDSEDSDSLKSWIDRAKRAHDLVEAVDLDKVATHDEIEVDKLETVASALSDLSDGRDIEHVEGVDEIMTELDPDQLRRSNVLNLLADNGYADRIGRLLYVHSGEIDLKPLEIVPHHEGLPDFDACVAPETSVHSGNFGIFVSAQGVFAASISEPVTTHHWRVVQSSPYSDDADLLERVGQFSVSAFD